MGDPHRGQGRIMALLNLQPTIGQKELSAILDMRSQSLGELLAKLERQGYITRSPSEADRRAMDIRLTDAGKAASAQPEESPDPDSLFGCLSEDEQATLSGFLGRLIHAWEESLSADGGEAVFPPGREWGGRGFGRPGGFPGFDRSRGGDPRRPPFAGRGFGGHTPDEE
jgi:DNA-binding MarR family transcriptional regulator